MNSPLLADAPPVAATTQAGRPQARPWTEKFSRRWRRFWVRHSGPKGLGKVAGYLASWQTLPYHGREFLARLHERGFVASSVSLGHDQLETGRQVYLGDRVTMWRMREGGPVSLGARVCLYGETMIATGLGGSIRIGEETHIQPGCHLYACVSDITIGRQVEIAARCAFYSYDHSISLGAPIMQQPLQSKGPIVIGDGAWLGHGATVLSGVRVGAGAVIAAGALVTKDIPENAIAAGTPARVLKFRPHT